MTNSVPRVFLASCRSQKIPEKFFGLEFSHFIFDIACMVISGNDIVRLDTK